MATEEVVWFVGGQGRGTFSAGWKRMLLEAYFGRLGIRVRDLQDAHQLVLQDDENENLHRRQGDTRADSSNQLDNAGICRLLGSSFSNGFRHDGIIVLLELWKAVVFVQKQSSLSLSRLLFR